MVSYISDISTLCPQQWQNLWASEYPFIQHGFLQTLEQTGCVSAKTGWHPMHAVLMENDTLAAAMPLYAKTHSYGEYVFDWSWADAYAQTGMDYYPKLLSAIPFTPATGPRMAAITPEHAQRLIQALEGRLQHGTASGAHILFPAAGTSAPQWQERWGCQFHWFNQGFSGFDDFLASFSSRKRKNVARERKKIAEQNLVVQRLKGEELTEEDWAEFYQLYATTYIKRSGHTGYLTPAFFKQIGKAMPEKVMLVKAFADSKLVAAALYFYDTTTLYGRYWGARHEFDALHFECCYYQGIEFAIEQGLQRFDPGAQGEHKVQRGFTPVLTRSLHRLAHPGFDAAVADFLQEEQTSVMHYCEQLRESLPFKEGTEVVSPHVLISPAGT